MLGTDEIVSLSELTTYIKQVLSLNFEGPVWIQAELGQVGVSKGHTYLTLIETNSEGKESARVKATIWYSTLKTLKQQHTGIDELLQRGREVLLCCSVEFHDIFGFSLNVVDLDPSYTLGKMEQQRLQAIKNLEADGSINKNSRLQLSPVPRRLALISSSRAAGFKDFQKQLHDNEYGYTFITHLFECAMQGAKVEADITSALRAISELKHQFDCVIIIRGGGSKLDLAAFDNENLARLAADCPLPILSGIGHEIDFSLIDLIAHSSVKTPTAAADFIISKIVEFESNIIQIGMTAIQNCQYNIESIHRQLEASIQTVEYRIQSQVNTQKSTTELQVQAIQNKIQQHIQLFQQQCIQAESAIQFLHPDKVLKRGFALVRSETAAITSSKKVQKNTPLTITFHDGDIKTITQ